MQICTCFPICFNVRCQILEKKISYWLYSSYCFLLICSKYFIETLPSIIMLQRKEFSNMKMCSINLFFSLQFNCPSLKILKDDDYSNYLWHQNALNTVHKWKINLSVTLRWRTAIKALFLSSVCFCCAHTDFVSRMDTLYPFFSITREAPDIKRTYKLILVSLK